MADEKFLRFQVVSESVVSDVVKKVKLTHFANDPMAISSLTSHENFGRLVSNVTNMVNSRTYICDAKRQLSAIISYIKRWMDSRQLTLNEDKTECLFVGQGMDFGRLNMQTLSLNNIDIAVTKRAKNLDVLLDSKLLMKNQINHTVEIAGYHLRNVAFVRKT
ncbi:uncharacterized protein [Palaemon carinicauda]|uniref:uncharacterized protein n=1 Tax=Palaemon carinicauda TaxID=392227 RepID=UPI0035B5A898